MIHRYREWRSEVLGVVIRVKGDFVQIYIISVVGNRQEG